jgi:Fic family protein
MVTNQGPVVPSHPWISFQVDLSRIGAEFWMLLGEARSKVIRLNQSLLRPEVAQQINTLYLAKGVHATTAIEGNTLSEEDAVALVEGRQLRLPPSREYLVREAENIVDACNWIKDELLAGRQGALTMDLVQEFNRRVLDGLELEDDVVPGEIRRHSVGVGRRYLAPPHEEVERLLARLFDWLADDRLQPQSADWVVPLAVVRAALAHLYIAWIHPFGDGNGRTARLVEVWTLLAAGFPLPAAHLLSNHYNETRTEYDRQLDYASRSGGDVLPFLRYAAEGFIAGLRVQLETIFNQQWRDRWEQYIYEQFAGMSTPARVRQRELALELSKHDEPIRRSDIPMLSVALNEAYRGTVRKLARDLSALVELGLVERTVHGYRPLREVLVAFLPLRPAALVDEDAESSSSA